MKKFSLSLLATLCLATPTFAQSGDVSNESDESSVAYLGALGLHSSEYFGSAEEETRVFPYVSVQDYKGFDLFATSLTMSMPVSSLAVMSEVPSDPSVFASLLDKILQAGMTAFQQVQSFFGITEAQSSASGLAVNDVDSGVYGYSVNLVSWYEITDNYVITAIGSHRWFSGEANDSPILLADDGADTGLFVSLGIARKFNL